MGYRHTLNGAARTLIVKTNFRKSRVRLLQRAHSLVLFMLGDG